MKLPKDLMTAVREGGADFSDDWKALSRDKVLDGRTIERYLNLFRELADISKARRRPETIHEAI